MINIQALRQILTDKYYFEEPDVDDIMGALPDERTDTCEYVAMLFNPEYEDNQEVLEDSIKGVIDSARSQELKQIMLDALNQADNGGE